MDEQTAIAKRQERTAEEQGQIAKRQGEIAEKQFEIFQAQIAKRPRLAVEFVYAGEDQRFSYYRIMLGTFGTKTAERLGWYFYLGGDVSDETIYIKFRYAYRIGVFPNAFPDEQNRNRYYEGLLPEPIFPGSHVNLGMARLSNELNPATDCHWVLNSDEGNVMGDARLTLSFYKDMLTMLKSDAPFTETVPEEFKD